MKIAIVCGHYTPEFGYHESSLANALSGAGHEVVIFTTNQLPPVLKFGDRRHFCYPVGQSVSEKKVTINRYKPWLVYKAVVLCRKIDQKINEYSPDVVIAIGIGKLFPYPVFKDENERSYRIISVFGDNQRYYSWDNLKLAISSIIQMAIKVFIKRWFYIRAARSSDSIIGYTPDTRNILSGYLPVRLKKAFEQKYHFIPLGFDGEIFNFSKTKRAEIRDELGLKEEDLLLITATKMNTGKKIDKVIEAVNEVHGEVTNLFYLMVGFQNDHYEVEIKRMIAKSKYSGKFIIKQFIDTSKLAEYYSAADFGIWERPAITIQQAMGTGLPLILEDTDYHNYLVSDDDNGWIYKNEELNKCLSKVCLAFNKLSIQERNTKRDQTCRYNDRFSYQKISELYLMTLEKLKYEI
jgi:glycosyltransferase involved in cell wall biosynthesis